MGESARQRAAASVKAYVPELADVAVLELGHGLDNTVFSAGDLVLRVANGHSVLCEARMLHVLTQWVSVPVPVPRFVDEDNGVLPIR